MCRYFLGEAAGEGEAFASAAAFGLAAGLAEAAGDASGDAEGAAAGAGVEAGVGAVPPSRTTVLVPNPGNENSKARNMKIAAAMIVAFSSGFCAPRGPKAVWLPDPPKAAATSPPLPDCNRITRIKKTQTRTKIALRRMSNNAVSPAGTNRITGRNGRCARSSRSPNWPRPPARHQYPPGASGQQCYPASRCRRKESASCPPWKNRMSLRATDE